jgi:hypothetical protein
LKFASLKHALNLVNSKALNEVLLEVRESKVVIASENFEMTMIPESNFFRRYGLKGLAAEWHPCKLFWSANIDDGLMRGVRRGWGGPFRKDSGICVHLICS